MKTMAYNGLTNLGAEHLAKCLANKTGITFTKIKVGNGNIPSEKTGQTTTELYGFKKDLEILAKEQVETALKLTVLLNNIDLNAGFYVKEIGVYVQDGVREILYWYINKDNPSYLPDKNTPSNHRYNLYLEVSPIQTTIVNFTGEGLLADKKYVNDSIKNFAIENEKNLELKFNKGQLPITFTSAETILKALQGNAGIKFDESLLYLNDSGTKKKGLCYLDKLTDGIFECIQETTTTVNNTIYFKNFSNKENSDRLSNLDKYKYEELKYSDWRLKLIRCGKIGICIATSLDLTSKTGSKQMPNWFMPLFYSGTIVGGNIPDSTGEIYIKPDGVFEWTCSTTKSNAYTGNIVTVLKD